MTVRLYLTNSAASYAPPTPRGAWADINNNGVSRLSPSRAGANTTTARSESSSSSNRKVLLRRWVSEPFNNAATFTGSMTLVQVVQESSTSMNAQQMLHAYVTVGSTDVVRGTLLNSLVSATEWPTTFAAMSGTATVSDVACQVGDRLVIEVGYNAANTSSSSFTGTLRYGGTGSDLTVGDVSSATIQRAPWVQLTGADILFAPPFRNGGTVTTTVIPTDATAAPTRKLAAGETEVVPGVESTLTTAVRRFLAASTPALQMTVTASRLTSSQIVTTPILAMPLTAYRTSEPVETETVPSILLIPQVVIEGDIDLPPPDVEVYSSFYVPPRRQGLRFIAQDIFTKQWLDWDLPVIEPEITWTLSGPTVLRGKIAPEVPSVRGLGLTPWGTWIHVEEDGQIRASGILQPNDISDGETLSIEAVGVADYAKDIPYLGNLSEVQIDPLDVVRAIWTHIQSYQDGNIGVTVAATTSPVRLGEPEHQDVNEDGTLAYDEEEEAAPVDDDGQSPPEDKRVKKTETDPETGVITITYRDGSKLIRTPRMVEAKPYQLLWYNLVNCGEEIDKLAKDTPFDYAEISRWNADKSAVEHFIDIGYPRLGGLRDDLRFAQDENLTLAVPLAETPDWYASGVVMKGNGEGQAGVYGYSYGYHPTRIRRVVTVTDKTVKDNQRALALASEELRRRQSVLTIGTISISDTHPNAPLGSYRAGDDITVQAEIPWHGETALKHRITAYTWRPDACEVVATLRRSEQFAYGRPAA